MKEARDNIFSPNLEVMKITIDGLTPATVYMAEVFALNSKGKQCSGTAHVEFTTKTGKKQKEKPRAKEKDKEARKLEKDRPEAPENRAKEEPDIRKSDASDHAGQPTMEKHTKPKDNPPMYQMYAPFLPSVPLLFSYKPNRIEQVLSNKDTDSVHAVLACMNELEAVAGTPEEAGKCLDRDRERLASTLPLFQSMMQTLREYPRGDTPRLGLDDFDDEEEMIAEAVLRIGQWMYAVAPESPLEDLAADILRAWLKCEHS